MKELSIENQVIQSMATSISSLISYKQHKEAIKSGLGQNLLLTDLLSDISITKDKLTTLQLKLERIYLTSNEVNKNG
jgi:hypothetical protein